MVISSNIIVSSRPPTRYITQPGTVDGRVVGGDGGGGAGAGCEVGFGDGSKTGGSSVVKAPTALHSLTVLVPTALTLQ